MAILLPEADLLELFTFTISKASGLILSFLVKGPPPKESVNSVPKVKEPPDVKSTHLCSSLPHPYNLLVKRELHS